MRVSNWAKLALVVVLLVGTSAALWAQDATFDINWDNQTLGAAMQQLQRAFNVQYTLPGELNGKTVTIHRQGVTVAQAITELAKAAGIRVITDPNGVYVFQAAVAATGGGGAAGGASAPAANPWAVGGAAVVAPAPTRPGVAGVPTGGAYAGYGTSTAGGGAVAGGANVLIGANGQPINPADLVFRVIKVMHVGADLMTSIFGGTTITDVQITAGGGGGGTSSGYGSTNTNSGSSAQSGSGYNANSASNTSGTSRSTTGTTGH